MENTFKEIVKLLRNGPIDGKENVFLNIFDILLSCTGQDEAKQYFTEDLLSVVIKFTGPNLPYKDVIYSILINIFSEEHFCENMCANKAIMVAVIDLSLGDVVNKNSKSAGLGCNLISNITRFENSCRQILDYISPLADTLHRIVSVFTHIQYNPSCSLDNLAMVLCNLSQLVEVRHILTQSDHCMMQKLVPFMNHENSIRRKGIVGVFHNCAFDSSVHSWMLSDEVDILPRILLPLAGPEQFDDEDNDKLPVDLQYLPDSKTREPDPEIRKQLLETLNQLCATKYGRQFLRDHNTYIILRELHKWEKDPSALLACENVVDILIRTEEEIGIDQMKTLEIPLDLEEKFNKLTS